MNAVPRSTDSGPQPPVTDGVWIGLGLLIVVVGAVLLFVADAGTWEFWPDSLVMGLVTAAASMILVMPGYLAIAGLTNFILTRFGFAPAVRRRWILGPPLLALAGVCLNLLNHQRPSVAFENATGAKAPNSLRRFYHAHGLGLMWIRNVAWFEMAPADLKSLVQAKGLTATNGISLHSMLNGDRWINRTSLLTRCRRRSSRSAT